MDVLADAQEDDLEPVGIAHAYGVEVCVAVALLAHLLASEEFFGAV